jgi:hypothetical protein
MQPVSPGGTVDSHGVSGPDCGTDQNSLGVILATPIPASAA